MVQLPSLDWLFLDSLPLRVEESVVQVNACLANQIVSEQKIVVICLDLQRRSSRESDIEIESFVELGVWLIVLVVILIVELHISTSNDQVRITWRTNVTRGKVIALD